MRKRQSRTRPGKGIPALAIAVAVALGFADGANGESNWTKRASLPSPTCCLAAAAGSEGTIFAIGGVDVFTGVSARVYRYRPSANEWFAAPDLPAPRAGHAAATGDDGRIYVVGGGDGHNLLSSVLALKPGSGAQWTNRAPLPTPRSDLGAATGPDGRIYVIGGISDSILDTLEIYDPATNKWTTGQCQPRVREWGWPGAVTDGFMPSEAGETISLPRLGLSRRIPP
jgi:N-acetylneuraminic acid mutarotase